MKTKREGKQKKTELDNEFRDEFSFGSYLHLVWRVEYLERQLRNQGVLHRRYVGCEQTIVEGKPEDEEASERP